MAERRLTLHLFRSHFAHDFQNLLLPTATLLGLLSKRKDWDAPTEQLLRVAHENLQVARDFLGRATQLRTTEPIQVESSTVASLVEAAVAPVRDSATARQVAIVCDGENSTVAADRNALPRALREIVKNAVAAAPAGSTVTVLTAREGAEVRIAVTDTGNGVPEELCTYLFRPFFAPRGPNSATRGFGLGLAQCQAILAAHGGSISYTRKNGETSFVVRLRAAPRID